MDCAVSRAACPPRTCIAATGLTLVSQHSSTQELPRDRLKKSGNPERVTWTVYSRYIVEEASAEESITGVQGRREAVV